LYSIENRAMSPYDGPAWKTCLTVGDSIKKAITVLQHTQIHTPAEDSVLVRNKVCDIEMALFKLTTKVDRLERDLRDQCPLKIN
jgi:hypothetical protein